jgi:hypothetical protein
MRLLSRESVFRRDNHQCIICKSPAKDAHHILERRLFPDGGYYLDNGASLCEEHHIQAETTVLSTQEIRTILNIKTPVLPEHFYKDQEYDKWGNIILPDGKRLKGELFNDESLQKILDQGEVLDLFVKYIKYPRTYHLPFSQSMTKDDRILKDCSQFENKNVVATLKMDGENTTMYNDYIHARSVQSKNHKSRDYVKSIHSQIMADIPEGWRVCGENLYAKHSIEYNNLESYFYIFSIWNDKNICLSWEETVEWALLLGLPHVPVLYNGVFDEKKIKFLISPKFNGEDMEGFVLRNSGEFSYKDFKNNTAKMVRKDHVHTHGHWMREMIVPNKLKK